MFGYKPKHNVTSPLDKRDYPELDILEILDTNGMKKY